MPEKASNKLWDNPKFLMDLIEGFYDAATSGGALSQDAKQNIEAYLKAKGHQTSWDAIRYDAISFFMHVAFSTCFNLSITY